jgi:chromosome partitioning protein
MEPAMNPLEMYNFLTNLLREGAGPVAALILGFFAGVFAGRWLFGRWMKGLRARIRRLEEEKQTLLDERISLHQTINSLNQTLGELRLNLQQSEEHVAKYETWVKKARGVVAGLTARVSELEGGIEKQRATIQRLTGDRDQGLKQLEALQGNLAELWRQVETVQQEREECERKYEIANTRCEELEAELDQSKEMTLKAGRRYRAALKKLREGEAHTQNILAQGGRVWERPLEPGAAPFRPLGERKMPIISILNLKGGVGKTTLTLNLAAALSRAGHRVLVGDIDHQRSLTLLALRASEINKLQDRKNTLQHFLLGPQRGANRLADCIARVPQLDNCSILVNSAPLEGSETLESVESLLMAQWLAKQEVGDVRLYLREALHATSIRQQFDYVLLDCPPRLSTACINALAASDFLLIPVILDGTSTAGIHYLLRELKRFRTPNLFPDFSILGIVANRTVYRLEELTGRQGYVWEVLEKRTKDVWGEKVFLFPTTIKQNLVIGNAASEQFDHASCTIAALRDATLAETFQQLAREVKERIKYESRRAAAVRS